MGTQISLEISYGGSQVDDDDRERAENAALAVIAAAGTTAKAAYAEFIRQMAEVDDYEEMAGLARVWTEAEEAANCALTETWAQPDGASCRIYA